MEEMEHQRPIWKQPYVIVKKAFLMMLFPTSLEWDLAVVVGFPNSSDLICHSKQPVCF